MSEVFTPQELVYLGALLFDLIGECPEHAKPIRDSLEKKLGAGLPAEQYKPFGVPIGRHGEPIAFQGTIDGKPVWSNGHILLFGECPWPDVHERSDTLKKVWDRYAESANEVWPRVILHETSLRSPFCCIFSDGSAYDLRYYDYLAATFPGARYFRKSGDEYTPLVIRSEGQAVALLQGLLRYFDGAKRLQEWMAR